MKKFLLLALLVALVSSFCTRDEYPCHPYDTGPCLHRVHAYDYDAFGNVYPCSHPVHAYDIYACTHVCY
jgi:hypothetical protein